MNNRHSRLRSHDLTIGWFHLVLGLLCVPVWAGPASPVGLKVGQRWQYRHEGPRPGSVEPNAVDGERILWVVSTIEEQGETRSVIEERFTNDAKVVGRLLVDPAGLLVALEAENEKGEVVRLRYDPPIPYQPVDMNVAEVKTFQTVLRSDSPKFALPVTTVVERLIDETVTTAAGEFPACSHYRSTTQSVVDVKIAKIPVREERERWHHPSIHGMVKEVYRKGPVKFLGWSRAGYTATSTLLAYGREEVPPITGTPARPGIRNDHRRGPTGPPARASRRWSGLLLVVGVVVFVAAVGGYGRRRRASGRRRTT
jgi:hypothetical protein